MCELLKVETWASQMQDKQPTSLVLIRLDTKFWFGLVVFAQTRTVGVCYLLFLIRETVLKAKTVYFKYQKNRESVEVQIKLD